MNSVVFRKYDIKDKYIMQVYHYYTFLHHINKDSTFQGKVEKRFSAVYEELKKVNDRVDFVEEAIKRLEAKLGVVGTDLAITNEEIRILKLELNSKAKYIINNNFLFTIDKVIINSPTLKAVPVFVESAGNVLSMNENAGTQTVRVQAPHPSRFISGPTLAELPFVMEKTDIVEDT